MSRSLHQNAHGKLRLNPTDRRLKMSREYYKSHVVLNDFIDSPRSDENDAVSYPSPIEVPEMSLDTTSSTGTNYQWLVEHT